VIKKKKKYAVWGLRMSVRDPGYLSRLVVDNFLRSLRLIKKKKEELAARA
jgi:hypothetical protein